ncbi:MAG: hypothetical protein EA350_08700 [Gemmatimonadales bacterium]|nr:MAG: hypothetical protein EA350_08700 [Gemmatimonadales bacterium]
MGHDWSYFLPLLLAGHYWIETNGFWVSPIFTPAFCGGLPLLANPQSVFYSLLQALTLLMTPVDAAFATLVLSATFGAAGFYLLLRRRFDLSPEAATFSAVAFLFNGFLIFRVIIGQPHFHSFALIPWIAYAALIGPGSATPTWGRAVRILSASGWVGLAVAYFVYSGSVNILVPAGLCVVVIWFIHALRAGPRPWFWFIGVLGGMLGAAISAANLVPTYVLMDTFPRTYGINLFDNPLHAIRWLMQGLFLARTLPEMGWFGRHGIGFGRPEAEFGVTVVPLILIGWALWGLRRQRVCGPGGGAMRKRRALLLGGPILLLLGLVFVMNIHIGGDAWHDVLKQVPYVESNAQLMRWWFVYIPIILLAAGLAFDRVLVTPSARTWGMTVGAACIILLNVTTDMDYYTDEPYDPALVMAGWRAVQDGEGPPPIRRVGRAPDEGGRTPREWVNDLNDQFVLGTSALPCYEPVFGYGLENFPESPLGDGPVGEAGGGPFNLANPACYIYGEENNCRPGDPFGAEEAAAAEAFAEYRPFPHERPRWQRVAGMLTAAGLGFFLLSVAVLPGLGRIRSRQDRRR